MKKNYIQKAFRAEWLKTKGLHLLITGIILATLIPLLVFIISLFKEEARTYNGLPTTVSENYLTSTLSGYAGFLMVIFIILAASRICQTDHKNNGWTFIETQPLSKFSIYTAKFLSTVLLTFISITAFILVNVILANVLQLIYPQENLSFGIDFPWLLHFYIRVLVMSLGIISLQLMLSVIIKGFVWPFMIGFLGFAINIAAKIRQETYDYIPFNNLDTSLDIKDPSQLNSFFNYTDILSLFWAVLFFVIGYFIYAKKGMKNAFFKNKKTMGMSILSLMLAVGVYFWIAKGIYPKKLDGITIIEGTIQSTLPHKNLKIYSAELFEPIAEIPIKDGKFHWETKNNLPLGIYIYDLDGKKNKFVLSKGDHIIFNFNEDKNQLDVVQKGTRKAESAYIENQTNGGFSKFYDFTVKNNEELDNPNSFYEAAQNEWKDNQKFINNYRTPENIHFGDDFYQFVQQQQAVKMLTAIEDYQRKTSFTDKKFAPPADFLASIKGMIKIPNSLLQTDQEYSKWKLNSLLPQNGTDNADSLIMSKLDLMPKSEEKDRLLKVQLLKNFELINNEKQRNELYLSKINQFSNPKYAEYIGSELKVINNQQKGTLLPKLELEDLEGKTLDLSKFKGKFVVIDFWATWCGPCRETSPMFEFQAKKFQRLGDIVFIAISVDAKKSDWQLFNKNKQSKVQQFWLKDKKIMPVLGINGIPRFMMVDKEGKMYNANMPRPNESNFSEIVNGASEFKFFSIDF